MPVVCLVNHPMLVRGLGVASVLLSLATLGMWRGVAVDTGSGTGTAVAVILYLLRCLDGLTEVFPRSAPPCYHVVACPRPSRASRGESLEEERRHCGSRQG